MPQVTWCWNLLTRLSVPGSFQDPEWPPFCGLWKDPRLKLGCLSPQVMASRPLASLFPFTLDSDRSSGFPYVNVEGGLIAQTAWLEDKWAPDICPAAVSPWFQTGTGERLGAFCFHLYCSRRHMQVHTNTRKHTQGTPWLN